jgi:histidinol phosphatase-like enzyme (inositol monophosphatase family)
MPPTELAQRLEFALAVSQEAAKLILSYYMTPELVVDLKRDRSPVTAADRGAEELIRDRIAQQFPDDGVFGEEFGESAGRNGVRWVLDPVDGTKAFIHGVPLFGTLIGLEANGELLAGVCRLPALNEVVYGGQGFGAWWQIGDAAPRRAKVSSIDKLEEAMVCTTSFNNWRIANKQSAFDRINAAAKETRGWSDCYGHALVITGRADVMLDPLLNPWDGAALVPILREAGGQFFDWTGTDTIHGGNGISTNGRLKNAVMAEIQRSA